MLRAVPSAHVPGALADDGGPEIEQLTRGRADEAEGRWRIRICFGLDIFRYFLLLVRPNPAALPLPCACPRRGSRLRSSVGRPETEEDVGIGPLAARYEALPASRFTELSLFAPL